MLQYFYSKKIFPIFLVFFSFFFIFSHVPVFSQSSTDFDTICKETLNSNQQNSQKYTYCQAASSSKAAAQATDLTWKIWVAVGAVCAAACGASIAGMSLHPYICPGATVAGSVSDAAITQNYMNAMMGIFAAGGSLIMRQPRPQNPSTQEKAQTKQIDLPACMLSANAAFMAFSDYQSMQSSLADETAQLNSAQSLSSSAQVAAASSNLNTLSTLPTRSAALTPYNNAYTPLMAPSLLARGATPYTGNCYGNTMNTTASYLQCAMAVDSKIPSFVTTPQFASNFQNTSRMSLPQFLSQETSTTNPAKALLAAMSGPLSTEGSMQLNSALKKMEERVAQNPAHATYVKSNTQNKDQASDTSGMPDFFSGMLKHLDPHLSTSTESVNGITQVFLENKKANGSFELAALAENRSLSLFDRITYRYLVLSQIKIKENL